MQVDADAVSVGAVAPDEDAPTIIANDEGIEAVEVAARVIAHIANRIPGFKKVEKMFEGKEQKSGMFADISALLVILYERNKHLGPIVVARLREAMEEARQRKEVQGGKVPEGSVRNRRDRFRRESSVQEGGMESPGLRQVEDEGPQVRQVPFS